MIVDLLDQLRHGVETRGDYDEAELLLNKMIAIRERFSGPPDGPATSKLGLLKLRILQGRLDEADKPVAGVPGVKV